MKEFFYALLYSVALFVGGYGAAYIQLAEKCPKLCCPCSADCCKKKPVKPCCPKPDCPPQGKLLDK